MIAPSSSRYSSNDIVHNHYLEEAKKKAQEHSRNSRNFSDSKHFVCSTCQKCVFNANHDSCVIKFLKEVNSRAKVPSNKTITRNKPVEQTRYIVQSYKGRTQSLVAKKKDISENRASRNFDLMITQMTFEHSSSSLGRQCQMASAENNTSGPVPQCLVLHQMTSDHNRSELGIHDHNNEQSSSKLVPKVVP
ncbi:hypothetical protein Tco_1556420 [Tanacetum coccineum]